MNIININREIMWHKDLYLRQKSRDLEKEEVLDASFKQLVNYMFQSLYENPIGVGLAAPQVGLMIRLVVIDLQRKNEKPLVLINPTYSPVGDELVDSNENCLSFENRRGVVRRYAKVHVCAKDINFEDIELEADGFKAMVYQHEIDHLNGIVYIDNANEVLDYQSHITRAEKALSQLYGC